MKIDWASFSFPGRKGVNEDALLEPVEALGSWWAGIADGMGGGVEGARASATALRSVAKSVERGTDQMSVLFRQARDSVVELAMEIGGNVTVGTTLSLIRITDKGVVEVGHVGDTRVYHLRAFGIMDRTVDQTEVRELIDAGVLKKKDASRYSRRSVLTSAITNRGDYNLFENTFSVQPGDRLVLSSDGFYNVSPRQQIAKLSAAHKNVAELMQTLEVHARGSEPRDDFTALAMQILQ